MQYAALKNLDRFGVYSDITGRYSRGGVWAGLDEYEMMEATPEIEKKIQAFRAKYELVEHCVEYEYPDDNDELGTGTSHHYEEYSEIGDACVFLLFENEIVGVAYPSFSEHMPVVWFHKDAPGYCSGDYAFHEKKK